MGSATPKKKDLDMSKDCGITWVSHFTDDIKSIESEVKNLQWPRGTTLTATAMAEVLSELTNSRKDANSVVMVITDGRPMSPVRTTKMASRLQQMARLLFVPCGPGAPRDLVKKWASKPQSDN